MKGAIAVGPVHDQRGRSGVAVGFVRKNDGGAWYQLRMILDPATGEPLSRETWALGSGRAPAKTGTLIGFDVIVRIGFTDDPLPTSK